MGWLDPVIVTLILVVPLLVEVRAQELVQFNADRGKKFLECNNILATRAFNIDISQVRGQTQPCECYIKGEPETLNISVDANEDSGYVTRAFFALDRFTAENPDDPSFTPALYLNMDLSNSPGNEGRIVVGGRTEAERESFSFGGNNGILLTINTHPISYFDMRCTNNNFGIKPPTTLTTTTTTTAATTTTTTSVQTTNHVVTVDVTKTTTVAGGGSPGEVGGAEGSTSSPVPIILGVCLAIAAIIVIVVIIVVILYKRRNQASRGKERKPPETADRNMSDPIYKPVPGSETGVVTINEHS